MHNDRSSSPAHKKLRQSKKPGRKYQMIFRQPGSLLETLEAFRPILANGLVLSFIGVLDCIFYRSCHYPEHDCKVNRFLLRQLFCDTAPHTDCSNTATSVILLFSGWKLFITQCNNTITGVVYEEYHTIATYRDRRRA